MNDGIKALGEQIERLTLQREEYRRTENAQYERAEKALNALSKAERERDEAFGELREMTERFKRSQSREDALNRNLEAAQEQLSEEIAAKQLARVEAVNGEFKGIDDARFGEILAILNTAKAKGCSIDLSIAWEIFDEVARLKATRKCALCKGEGQMVSPGKTFGEWKEEPCSLCKGGTI